MPPSSTHDPVATAFLLVETRRGDGTPVWAVKWRSADGTRVRRRLGADAWVVRGKDGGWSARSGRSPDGALTEFQARRRMGEFVRAEEAVLAEARKRRRAGSEKAGAPTFRTLAHDWLSHLDETGGAKPSTLRDYRSMLAEPGVPHRRGPGLTIGRVMAALGDRPASEVSRADVEAMLGTHAREGGSPRSVNKHRQVIVAIFNYGLREGNAERFGLSVNPAAGASKRREDGPARLEVFTVEEVEALARMAGSGAWRTPAASADHEDEDAQFAELIRIAAYTGLRRGELVVLRWRDVRFADRVLVVERALSATVEGTPKSRRARYVPLGDQALSALDRLVRRENFTGADDYAFCNPVGDRLDPSAIRRRFVAARDAAGLPPLRFHDLRHTAGTLLTRVLDPVTVRDVLGHADLKTTERYLHSVRASRLADAATRAFTSGHASSPSVEDDPVPVEIQGPGLRVADPDDGTAVG